MIIEFYPNPNKPKPFALVPATTGPSGYLEHQATQRGISVDEFLRRDNLVREAAQHINYYVGATVYPHTKKEYDSKGKCRILSIARTYKDLGKDYEWEDKKPLFIVGAAAEKTSFSTFYATAGFFINEEPTK